MTETDTNEKLLRGLVESITLEHQHLQLKVVEHPARVYWNLRASINDTPLIVGTQGSHVKALTFLVQEMGRNADKHYVFNLLDPSPGHADEIKKERRVADDYDPEPAQVLLEELLAGLGVGMYKIEHVMRGRHEDGRLRNELTIHVRDEDDYKLLTVPPKVRDDQTIVTAIGTLFRAAANIQGVRMQVEVKQAE